MVMLVSSILSPEMTFISDLFTSNGFEIRIAGGAVRYRIVFSCVTLFLNIDFILTFKQPIEIKV